MSGTTAELHMFPRHADKFITWGSEICLYQVKSGGKKVDTKTLSNINLQISDVSTATLLAAETRYQYIRCVAPSHKKVGDLLLAVGLANGKVGLCNFVASTENNIEFTPKQSRPCVALAWHETETNLLAIGHDRNRSDHCITVWDTERGLPKEKSILNLIGLSETAHSICWDKQSKLLLAGMSHKYIKLMDLRQSNPLVTATNTRAVHGLATSSGGRYLASYIDNLVTLWDIRNIEKPLTVYQMEKNVNSISWCTTRPNTLATLQRDSAYVHLFDVQSLPPTAVGGGNVDPTNATEPHAIKRLVAPFQPQRIGGPSQRNITLANISWHPVDFERLFALSGSGQICDFRIPQRVGISVDPFNNICGSSAINFKLSAESPPASPTESTAPFALPVSGLLTASSSSSLFDYDIADTMRRRAINDYGKWPDIQKNGDLTQCQQLKIVWKLLTTQTSSRGEESFSGLQAILGMTATTLDGPPMCHSDTVHINWLDYSTAPKVKTFRCEQRDAAHHLCGWTFDKNSRESFQNFVDHLCAKNEFTRAAMIACFQLKIRCAIDILGMGADRSQDCSNLRMAAIALSGLNFDKGTIWRQQCMAAHEQIDDPHVRAMFAFLTPDNDHSYDTVLEETGVSVSDRMAFACQYLCDTKLAEYVKDMIQICVETGDLNGLILTGATSNAVRLLQSYVEWSQDVQTVALISIKFLSKTFINDEQVLMWINCYRDLLDKWCLWEQRAHFDIQLGQIQSSPKYARSVYLLCSFCGKSVSAYLQEESRMRPTSPNVNKLSSCPTCRKPLPRCSLCLLHMGTTTDLPSVGGGGGTNGHHVQVVQSGGGGSSSAVAVSSSNSSGGYGVWQSKPFSKWFSWCQTCRHGGHTDHLTDWFRQHSECPVAACSCKCFAVDLGVPQFQKDVAIY